MTDYYKRLEDAGHVLKRDKNGDVDEWVLEYDIHNGPGCINCDESWCRHCEDKIKPCIGREATDARVDAMEYELYLKLKEKFEP